MELHWIPATKQALLAATQQQAWHIFHYIGHGDFDAAAGDGRLAFTDAAGATDFVTARSSRRSSGRTRRSVSRC